VLLFLPILSGQISISTHLDFLFKCVRARCMFDCVCVCDCSCPSSPDRYPSACPWTSCSSVCVRVVCLCVRVCVCLFSPILSGHIPISMPLDFLFKCVRTCCLFVCESVCVCFRPFSPDTYPSACPWTSCSSVCVRVVCLCVCVCVCGFMRTMVLCICACHHGAKRL